MSEKDIFKSIAELAFSDQPVGRLATAIEKNGFYTWDKFGRYIHVPPVGEENLYSDIRDEVLKELAKGYKDDEEDSDYFYEMMKAPTRLNRSGWTQSTLPGFEELQAKWNNEYIGTTKAPALPEPAVQHKVWDVFKGLLKLTYGDDVIDDLMSGYSKMAKEVCDDLATKNVNIVPSTLKGYLEKKD